MLLWAWAIPGWGATYLLPTDGSNIVGQLRVVVPDPRNTLLDIARHYDLGYNEITAANPGVSIWLPGAGRHIVVPTEFILPPRPWAGIVINIPQRRLYYFPRRKGNEPATVVTFPIGISRPGWSTPLGNTRITAKYKDPSWWVPKDIQEEHRQQGDANFPTYFPPGPNNPMGMLALRTGFAQIYIHGTNRPWGVGMRVSHGCLHLYPENAAYLFPHVPVGTPVRIIDEPVLVGLRRGELYLSVSDPVDGYPGDRDSMVVRALDALVDFKARRKGVIPKIDWGRVRKVVEARQILPVPISVGSPGIDRVIAGIKPEQYGYAPYGSDANDAAPPTSVR